MQLPQLNKYIVLTTILVISNIFIRKIDNIDLISPAYLLTPFL